MGKDMPESKTVTNPALQNFLGGGKEAKLTGIELITGK